KRWFDSDARFNLREQTKLRVFAFIVKRFRVFRAPLGPMMTATFSRCTSPISFNSLYVMYSIY
ncbi:hypothetical protein AAHB54_14370, partial [Bacillus cereus]